MRLPENNADLADDALIGPPIEHLPRPLLAPIKPQRGAGRKGWLWVLLGVMVIPLGLTLASALTSPPHVRGVASGHLVYLEADAPSERTTTLRGMYLADAQGPPRPLVREYEPQEINTGVREWITQPAISPDGSQVAYEKQIITLIEEKQSLVNQLWVVSVEAPREPRLILDLTQHQFKQPVGLAWSSNTTLLFLEDSRQYTVPTNKPGSPQALSSNSLNLSGLTLSTNPAVSATRRPALAAHGTVLAYGVQTAQGTQVRLQQGGRTVFGPVADVFALAPSGSTLAYVPPGTRSVIRLYDIARSADGPDIAVRWGWSVFGRRKITSLCWSPDGTQIAYTVRKPPVPDDEIFVVDLKTRTTVQLPYRTGPAAWNWGK